MENLMFVEIAKSIHHLVKHQQDIMLRHGRGLLVEKLSQCPEE